MRDNEASPLVLVVSISHVASQRIVNVSQRANAVNPSEPNAAL